MNYRADIDGLRAVAVLSVIAFHLSSAFLPGGYLGVDIFFVISGFLITSIIWKELNESGVYSIRVFYNRRVRRIMPALLALIFTVTITSIFILLPSDLVRYSKSVLATLSFTANIYFWRDTNYFSPAAEDKPLLHLWSLGVEEQFYILFPVVIIFISRYRREFALPIIILLSVLSFFTAVFVLSAGGGLPAFFLLPTRAWELGAGACLALLPRSSMPRPILSNILALIGGALILQSLINPRPEFSIVPVSISAVLGSMLLIYSGQNKKSKVGRVLSLKPVVFVGLISYSLYLWHWPVIVFFKYYLIRDLSLFEVFFALSIMTCCAVISWRYVERPFRGSAISIKKVWIFSFGGSVLLAFVALIIMKSDGFPERLNKSAFEINKAVDGYYRCPVSDYISVYGSRGCLLNLPSRQPEDADVVLLGNSNALMYAPVWASILAEKNKNGLLISVNACLPTTRANISKNCGETAAENIEKIGRLEKAETVIVGLTWWHDANSLVDISGNIVDNSENKALIMAVDDLVRQLKSKNKRVVIIGPIAHPGWEVASVLSREIAFDRQSERKKFLLKSDFLQRFETLIQHFEGQDGIVFVRPDRIQCDLLHCNYLIDGRSLFGDGSHLAEAELHRFRDIFSTALEEVNERSP